MKKIWDDDRWNKADILYGGKVIYGSWRIFITVLIFLGFHFPTLHYLANEPSFAYCFIAFKNKLFALFSSLFYLSHLRRLTCSFWGILFLSWFEKWLCFSSLCDFWPVFRYSLFHCFLCFLLHCLFFFCSRHNLVWCRYRQKDFM